jgi:hypothetical protein
MLADSQYIDCLGVTIQREIVAKLGSVNEHSTLIKFDTYLHSRGI